MQPNILVIRLSSLGDIVLTVPVYRNLKAHWPGCRVSVLVKPQYAPVLEGHPCVDEIISFRGLWDCIRLIRGRRFTHCLDLHSNFRSFVIRHLAAIPNTVHYRKDALARRLFVSLGWASPSLTKHTINRYLDSLSVWNVATPDRALRFGDWKASPNGADPELKRILLVQTAFLGDATLTLPMARDIKKLLPDCHLTVLCRADTAEIFHSSSWVDETLQDDKRGAQSGIFGLWRLSQKIRESGFDVAVVPHRSLRSALLVRLAGIPRRIGFSSSAGRFLFTQTLPFTWGMHDLERNLGLLLPLSPTPPQTPTEQKTVYLQPQARKEACRRIAQLLSENGIATNQRLVGFHPGSIWPTKRWPEDRYAALIRQLSSQADIRPILIGGKNDIALAAKITREAQIPILDLTGKTSLSELIALMGRLSLFITNDSGPMHVATACGVPTLAFFGPTTKELGFFPYGPEHRVLEVDLACRPCGLHGAKVCPEGHFLCMRLISVDRAVRTVMGMLNAKTAPLERTPA